MMIPIYAALLLICGTTADVAKGGDIKKNEQLLVDVIATDKSENILGGVTLMDVTTEASKGTTTATKVVTEPVVTTKASKGEVTTKAAKPVSTKATKGEGSTKAAKKDIITKPAKAVTTKPAKPVSTEPSTTTGSLPPAPVIPTFQPPMTRALLGGEDQVRTVKALDELVAKIPAIPEQKGALKKEDSVISGLVGKNNLRGTVQEAKFGDVNADTAAKIKELDAKDNKAKAPDSKDDSGKKDGRKPQAKEDSKNDSKKAGAEEVVDPNADFFGKRAGRKPGPAPDSKNDSEEKPVVEEVVDLNADFFGKKAGRKPADSKDDSSNKYGRKLQAKDEPEPKAEPKTEPKGEDEDKDDPFDLKRGAKKGDVDTVKTIQWKTKFNTLKPLEEDEAAP